MFASVLMALAICFSGATEARAISVPTIDAEDDGYVAEAGSGNWTTEHDEIFQTSVGSKLDLCSDMSLDSVLTAMDGIEASFAGIDTSIIDLSDTNGDLTVTMTVPKGITIDASKVYMVENDLYYIASKTTNGTTITDSSNGTITGPGTFEIKMSLKTSYTKYDALKAGISGLAACDMASTVPNDGFQHEIRVIFPDVLVNSDMTGELVTTGYGTMSGGFSATASVYGGLITKSFSIPLTSHQYAAGLDANEATGSKKTSVTVKVNPATSVTATKVWSDANNQDGIRPDSVTLQLYKTVGGTTSAVSGKTVTLDAAGNWTATLSDLPSYEGGEKITYSVKEDTVPEGYAATYSTDGLTVTNTHVPGTTTATATKVWSDENDKDGIRPDSVTLQLYKTVGGTTSAVSGKTVTLDAAGNWTATLSNLPAYENGKKITYSYKENSVPDGYQVTYSADGLTVTNTHVPATPATNTTTTTTVTKSAAVPSTGDGTNMTLIYVLAGVAVVACGLGIYGKRKNSDK